MKTEAKLLVALVLSGLSLAGCANDAPKRGVQGESCKSSGDCGGGLVCMGFVCASASSGLAQAENECVEVECTSAEDCCLGRPTGGCGMDCRGEKCVQTCSADIECPGACVGGVCVDCGTDDDCPTGALCIDQECEPACRSDAECPALYACQEGVCVDVGCQSDRVCIALLGSVRAECRAGKCVVPCTSDAECGGEDTRLTICSGGECTPIGCETASECRARLGAGEGSRLECRPRTAN